MRSKSQKAKKKEVKPLRDPRISAEEWERWDKIWIILHYAMQHHDDALRDKALDAMMSYAEMINKKMCPAFQDNIKHQL